jgi:predicted nucleotidyltransferase
LDDVVRGFRDRDYLETTDNLFFAVVGNTHPKDRVLAYLKYVPDSQGKWGKKSKRFTRSIRYYSATSIMRTVNFLSKRYPQYVFHDERSDIVFSAVPRGRIIKHHRPEERLEAMRVSKHLDRLEKRTTQLASILSTRSGVPPDRLGVTGSILIGVQTSFSDIDLIVYGVKESGKVKEALLELYAVGRPFRRFTGSTLLTWCREQCSVHPLTIEEAKNIYARSWNKGIYKNIVFSVHPVRTDRGERVGGVLFKSRGVVEISARVTDASESCFLPATYRVTNVQPETSEFRRLDRVVSYESLYADIAKKDEEIVVRGKLEEATDPSGRMKYRRVLVGSADAGGCDFVKVKETLPTSQ